jgi:hypothetical protein
VDRIALSRGTFGAIRRGDVAIVLTDKQTDSCPEPIVYSQATGSLYFNANGSQPGYGMGGRFAIVNSNQPLSINDFQITGQIRI